MTTDRNNVNATSDVLLSLEKQKKVLAFNDTRVNFPKEKLLHQLFEEQALKTPNAIALRHQDNEYSYKEVNLQANRLAHYLKWLGIEPDDCVGVCLERNINLVVAVLAVLKAGGAYVPMDPLYPVDRIGYMLQDSKPKVLLMETSLSSLLSEINTDVFMFDVNTDISDSSNEQTQNLSPEKIKLKSINLAYVSYTSGSTGKPKGVAIEHRSVVNFVLWACAEFPPIGTTSSLFATSLNFDLSVFELFVPLISGGIVRIVDDALAISQAPEDSSLINAVPSAVSALLDIGAISNNVQLINFGGYSPKRQLVDNLFKSTSVKHIANLFGPTETTVYSTWVSMTRKKGFISHIGRPIANTQIYILDEDRNLVDVGVIGEIHIAGAGVARGYLNRPELTKEKFITDPFSQEEGARMYKTGDLGRWLADGNVEFLGRNDFQVKMRGYRIELGEIESQLERLVGVRDALVVAQDGDEEKQLVAYLIIKDDVTNTDFLRKELTRFLPQYMIPSAFIILDTFPLTPNGKIDRSALPKPDRSSMSETTYVEPQGDVENAISLIWQELLVLTQISRFDHFLELGGHSILVVKLVSRLRQDFSIALKPSDVFENPTLHQLAKYISTAKKVESVSIELIERNKPLSLSKEQQRLYFLSQLEPAASVAYHVANSYRLIGSLDFSILQRVMNCLIKRHEILRTVFTQIDGVPMQNIQADSLGFDLFNEDLTQIASKEQNSTLVSIIKENILRPFDLELGSLFRGGIIKLSSSEHILCLVQHHIITDGWSNQLLLEEITKLYSAFSQGLVDPLPEQTLQYADYAAWQHQQLLKDSSQGSLDFWCKQLKGAPSLLTLPLDNARPSKQSYRGNQLGLTLDSQLTSELQRVSKQHGMTLFMTLLSGWACLLARLSGQKDVVIGSPVANRPKAELESVLGFFANTIALRINLDNDPSINELFAQVKKDTLASIEHQSLPLDKLVEKLNPKRSLSYNPLFQSMFVMENQLTPNRSITSNLTISEQETPHYTTLFDLSLKLNFDGDCLSGSIEYAEDLFEEGTVLLIAEELISFLKNMVADQQRKVSELPLNKMLTLKAAVASTEIIKRENREYWQSQLGDSPELHGLSTDYLRKPQSHSQNIQLKTVHSRIGEDFAEKLLQLLGKDEEYSTSLLHAAFSIVLSRNSYSQDILVGVPLVNHKSKNSSILALENLLVIRTNTAFEKFDDYLNHVQKAYSAAKAHDQISFSDFINLSNNAKSQEYTPVIQIMFSTKIDSQSTLFRDKLLQTEEVAIATQLDLALCVKIQQNELLLCWEYNGALFKEATIEQLNAQFEQLLHSISSQPNARMIDLQILSVDEQDFLINKLNKQQEVYSQINQTVSCHQLFEQQCLLTPSAIALVDDNERITYSELNKRANQLAHYIKHKGVNAGNLVGICTDRSSNMVITVLAVLKTGAGYVPMDNSYPVQRLEYIVTDSQMKLLLTDSTCPTLILPKSCNQISLTDHEEQIKSQKVTNLETNRNLLPHDLCYVVYTSGSTGNPKGVKMPHRVLFNLISTMTSQSALFSKPLSWLQYVSPGFDMCFADIFMSLSRGGMLRLIPKTTQQDISLLLKLLADEKIEALNLPYAVLQLLASKSQEINISLPHLQLVLSAAEQMRITEEIRIFFIQQSNCLLINQYGPSETHVITGHVLSGNPMKWPELPPIGRLLPNVEGYVLDTDKNLVPFGCLGELHIGEFSSCSGYVNLPDVTQASFITQEGISDQRLYNTGDLVRYRENGELDYFGRKDKQVKIRGFRIELGEIEAKLESFPNVNSALVLTYQINGSETNLAAYVVCGESSTPKETLQKNIKKKLKAQLPQFMVPNRIIVLPRFPLTLNGKVDRAALPKPEVFEPINKPATTRELLPEELQLAAIWCEVLNLKQINPTDEFFELGGHSLLAMKLLSRIEEVFGISFGLSTLFEAPSLEEMAIKILHESANEQSSLLERLLNDIESLSGEEVSEQLQGELSPLDNLSVPVKE